MHRAWWGRDNERQLLLGATDGRRTASLGDVGRHLRVEFCPFIFCLRFSIGAVSYVEDLKYRDVHRKSFK